MSVLSLSHKSYLLNTIITFLLFINSFKSLIYELTGILASTKDITISIEVIGNNYSYMKLPNNDVTRDSKLEYVIKENGTYTFQAFDKDNQYKAKTKAPIMRPKKQTH